MSKAKAELEPAAVAAINRYLGTIVRRTAILFGVVNVLALWGIYSSVKNAATSEAQQEVQRIVQANQDLRQVQVRAIESAVASVSKHAAAQERFERWLKELDEAQHRSNGIKSSLDAMATTLNTLEGDKSFQIIQAAQMLSASGNDEVMAAAANAVRVALEAKTMSDNVRNELRQTIPSPQEIRARNITTGTPDGLTIHLAEGNSLLMSSGGSINIQGKQAGTDKEVIVYGRTK